MTAMTRAMRSPQISGGSGAVAGLSALPKPALPQPTPIKIGLMTVKTGGLAAGGVHLEEGITCFLKDKNFTLAGRKIDLIVADTAGVPATAKTKAVELVERDKVDLIMGPLAAFEWLAIKDYLGEHKMPDHGLRRRRRSDAASPRSLSGAHLGQFGAVPLSARRLRGQGNEAQGRNHRRRRFRLRLRAGRRFPVGVRG